MDEEKGKSKVLVSYLVSQQGHDGYCSENDDVDGIAWIKLKIIHRYHNLDCRGVECTWDKDENSDNVQYQVCGGTNNVEKRTSFDFTSRDFGQHVPKHKKLCYPTPPDLVHISSELSKYNKEKTLSNPLQISEFTFYDDSQIRYSIGLNYKELRKIALDFADCDTEVTHIERSGIELPLPKGYKCKGRITDKERLSDLFFKAAHSTTDECSSGVCGGSDIGTYYIPISALLLRKS